MASISARVLPGKRLTVLGFMLVSLSTALAQTVSPSDDPVRIYQQLKSPTTIEKSIHLENAVLQRDRVTITFTNGTVFLPPAVAGKVRSAVFIGSGTILAEAPNEFEKENVRRLLKADDVSSDFKAAVLRFTDDTADELIKAGSLQNAGAETAPRLAADLDPYLLKQTGMNISARQLESILNHEDPGVFLIHVEGGKRGKFTYLFDPQARIPTSIFDLNAGEKGLIFADAGYRGYDIWMAFPSKDDYANGRASYSDVYNLVTTEKYTLKLDVMNPKSVLGLDAKLDLVSRVDGLRVIAFAVGESLPNDNDLRRTKQLYMRSAQLQEGTPLTYFQEPWEGGFTIVLSQPVPAGQRFSINVNLRGDFMMESQTVAGTYFPRSTETWYPRHGYLARAQFDVSITHRKKDKVVSIGELVNEGPAPDSKDAVVTEFHLDQPVPLVTFAVGDYEVHKDTAKQSSGKDLPLEFYSMPGRRAVIKEDFILAEMSNSIRFFSQMFGDYPYPIFRGVFHPFNFGQGFPTTIMIPAADSANKYTFSFIAHETSHQWWGDMVLWRSYRDQWLSEGFAEYSGMMYAQFRANPSAEKELIQNARRELKLPPVTLTGIRSGRLEDIGPLLMGHRVESRETYGAYSALTYAKGALVLRMLHFLFTDPQTGDGKPFFDFMRDFVRRYQGGTASTEQFFTVANEHVGDTALARRYGYKDLNWFFRQWVTQTYLPSYNFSYHIEETPSGPVLKGVVSQSGLPEGETWFMPLPLVIHFQGGTMGRTTVAVLGAQSPISLQLPRLPEKVELDPELWVLSDKTSTDKH